MKKRALNTKSRTQAKKPDKKTIAKLTKDYRKFFVPSQPNAERFEIFTAYDYGTATEFTNHS